MKKILFKIFKILGFRVISNPKNESIQKEINILKNTSDEDLNKLNEKILEGLHNDGRIFISSTKIDNIYTLRFAILSFRTHKREIDLILEMMEEQAVIFGLK